MFILSSLLIGFIIISNYYMTQVESVRDKPNIPANPSGGRQKPGRPPVSPKNKTPTITPDEQTETVSLVAPEETPTGDVGVAIEKTRTRIKRNYNKSQRYYDKIMNESSVTPSDNESITSSGTEEMTEIRIRNLSDSPPPPERRSRTKEEMIRSKLVSVTQSAINEVKDGIDNLLTAGDEEDEGEVRRKRIRRKAKAGGIGGLIVLVVMLIVALIVYKI